jgi:hypothetical protein
MSAEFEFGIGFNSMFTLILLTSGNSVIEIDPMFAFTNSEFDACYEEVTFTHQLSNGDDDFPDVLTTFVDNVAATEDILRNEVMTFSVHSS